MRYRTVHVVALTTSIAIVAVATVVLANQRPQPIAWMLLSGVVAILAYYAIMLALQLTLRRAYVRAGNAEDTRALREAFDRYAEMYEGDRRPHARAQLALHEATVLAREQRWREAVECLERVGQDLPYVGPLRAFVLAHLGEEAAALELIDQSIANAREAERAALLGTRGVVLQRLGRNEEAREVLSTRKQIGTAAATLFYLGEAERALGHIDEAVAAYEGVLALPGESGWHRSAREALSALQTRTAPFR